MTDGSLQSPLRVERWRKQRCRGEYCPGWWGVNGEEAFAGIVRGGGGRQAAEALAVSQLSLEAAASAGGSVLVRGLRVVLVAGAGRAVIGFGPLLRGGDRGARCGHFGNPATAAPSCSRFPIGTTYAAQPNPPSVADRLYHRQASRAVLDRYLRLR